MRDAAGSKCVGNPADNPQRRIEQLAGGSGITERVRSLVVKAESLSVHVEPGAHAIATLRRRVHGNVVRKPNVCDSLEPVAEDVLLQAQLPRISDMTEHIAAASEFGIRSATIGGLGLDHLGRSEGHASSDLIDTNEDAFPRDRARHEHDLTLVTRQHPTTRRRLLDGQRQNVTGFHVNRLSASAAARGRGWPGRRLTRAFSSTRRVTYALRTV